MTAIVKHAAEKPPAVAWAGLALPGLGHLLLGQIVTGLGMILVDLVLVWAALAGLPRLGEVLGAPWNAGGLDLLLRVGLPLAAGAGHMALVGWAARTLPRLGAIGLGLWQGALAVYVFSEPLLWLGSGALLGVAAAFGEAEAAWAQTAASGLGLGLVVVAGLGTAWASVRANASDALAPFGTATAVAFLTGALLVNGLTPWDRLIGQAVQAFPLHPVLALAWLFGLGGVMWWRAWRLAVPRALTEEERNSNRAIFLRQLSRHRTGMMGLFGVLLLVSFVALTPLLAPFNPDAIDAGPAKLAPGWAYLMGTDMYGRDLFTRVLYGGRISLSIGFIAVSIAATIGTVLGATAAFAGGRVDSVIMWFVDMLLSLPRLILLLSITGLFRFTGTTGIYMIVIILGLTGWMGVCRIVRSQVLSLKQQDFTQAARALGYSSARIVLRHLIPNTLAPVIVYCSLAIGSTMITEAGLSFLGLGVPPPTATWGTIIDDGKDLLRNQPWIAVFPGLCIVFAVMSFNLLGDGLRDALDPKLRGR